MKRQIHSRAKNSAAKVPAQTQNNQFEPGSEQYVRELAAAKRTVARFYSEARLKKYEIAVHELAAFGCAIQHHPELQPIVRALQELHFAEDSLDAFECESNAGFAAGQRSALTEEECEARHWFSGFYKRVQEKTFLDAQYEYGGFYPWIKGNRGFSEVEGALALFQAAAGILDRFMDAILNNEGSDITAEQGGAR